MSTNQHNLLPAYLIIGNDKLKQKIVLKRLDSALKNYGDMSFNTNIFDGDSALGQDIINACMQIPLTASKRYVLLKNADKLKKSETKYIEDYLSKPNPSTILVLCYNKLASNTHVYKAASNLSPSSIIDCHPPKKYKFAQSLNAIAKSHNGSINFNAAQKLVELVGDDTMKLDEEIQKLLLANKGSNITIEQVISQVTKSADVKPWDFTNAFAQRDLNKCINLYKDMPEGCEYQLLPQTCRIIKELICVQDLGTNASQQNIARELNYDLWRVKNHYSWAHNFTKENLLNILQNALDCEIKMKSTTDSALAFENFIIKSLSKN